MVNIRGSILLGAIVLVAFIYYALGWLQAQVSFFNEIFFEAILIGIAYVLVRTYVDK